VSGMPSSSPAERLVAIAANTAWSIANFRARLIQRLQAAGYEVVAIAPRDEYADRLPCRFEPIRMDRKGVNPFEDLRLFFELRSLYRRLGLAAAFHFTAKLNIYGTLAARGLGICCVNNISGLGSGFLGGGVVSRIQQILYRLALKRSALVFFQNRDDAEYFLDRGLVPSGLVDLLPGSGVDLKSFLPRGKVADGPTVFLLIARLIRDKGISEYAEAARRLKTRYPHAVFQLLGFFDLQNPTAISRAEVDQWVKEGSVVFLGRQEDVREAIAGADCVVLPSYREGTPRTLLEAASMARPVITTDVPGCRQVVDDGETGFLCRVRDAADLAAKMDKFLLLDRSARASMGERARRKMESEFDEALVVEKYLAALKRFCS
jgi:glycosyltransferase involved in cell wall biosynthesis